MIAEEKMVTFSIQVPEKMHTRLCRLAKAQDRGLGPQVRVILARYLPEVERETVDLPGVKR